MTTADDGTSFSDADEAPDDDTTQEDAQPQQYQAGAHPIPDEPNTSTGQAAVPAPDTNAE